MKLLVSLLFSLFTFTLSIRLRKTETSNSKATISKTQIHTRDIDSYKAYIDETLHGMPVIVGLNQAGTEVAADTAIGQVGGHIAENIIKKGIKWNDVKKFFYIVNNNQLLPYMKKFLHLRMEDLLFTIKKTLGVANYFEALPDKKCDNNANNAINIGFTGTYGTFLASCFKVKIDQTWQNPIIGQFKFITGGSQSLTSDIDLSVDFIHEGGDNNNDVSLHYKRLKAVARFIEQFNLEFERMHTLSSLETYDVNLYSSNFAYPEIIKEMFDLKAMNNGAKFKVFAQANRLAQLMLIFNDAKKLFEAKTGAEINLPENEMKALYEAANPNPNNDDMGKCATSFALDVNDIKKVRVAGHKDRNTLMVSRMEMAGNDADRLLRKRLCNVLGSNYYALEAYVSYGAVIDILMLQGILIPANLPPQLRPFVNNPDQNAIVDSVLMNFAYAVEHYYEKVGEDDVDAHKKFGKYSARLFRAAKKITNNDAKTCWINAFANAGLWGDAGAPADYTSLAHVKAITNTLRLMISDVNQEPLNGNNKFALSKNFFNRCYACVATHHLAIIE